MDAIALAEFTLGVPQLILAVPPAVPANFEAAFEALLRRRESREPLQHILGTAAFRHLRVPVVPGVFLPRPETEVVTQPAVDEARRLIQAGELPLVVDLCSGSGVIGLSVAVEVPGSTVIGIDVDTVAVAAATSAVVAAGLVRADAVRDGTVRDDALLAGDSTVQDGESDGDTVRRGTSEVDGLGGGGIRFEVGDVASSDLLCDVEGAVDVVISNPPYIPDDAVPLDREVVDHDPPHALFGGGADGLDLPRRVVDVAVRLLRPGGLFVMEHADVQGGAVRDLIERTDAFGSATTHQDLTGRDRFVTARRRDA